MKWIVAIALISTACANSTVEEPFRRFAKTLGGTEWSGAIEAPANPTWKIRIDQKGENGEPLNVSGTIFKSDGKTPAPGVLLYVYHTDSKGEYSRGSGRGTGPRHGKLRGWMLTGPDGKYEFRTIKAGQYPGRGANAHIHATLTAEGVTEHWIEDFLFEGDDLIPAAKVAESRRMGSFAFVMKLTKDRDGVWQAKRDLKLK